MLSKELEHTITRAMALANEHAHEFATLEHLLVSLLDDPDAKDVLLGCQVDIEKLRELLISHIEDELTSIISADPSNNEVQPTAGFQRVVQRAIIHTQSSGRGFATGGKCIGRLSSPKEIAMRSSS